MHLCNVSICAATNIPEMCWWCALRRSFHWKSSLFVSSECHREGGEGLGWSNSSSSMLAWLACTRGQEQVQEYDGHCVRWEVETRGKRRRKKDRNGRAGDNREGPRHPWPVVAADNALVSLLPAYHLHLSWPSFYLQCRFYILSTFNVINVCGGCNISTSWPSLSTFDHLSNVQKGWGPGQSSWRSSPAWHSLIASILVSKKTKATNESQ